MKSTSRSHHTKGNAIAVILIVVVLWGTLSADPVDEQMARRLVQGWLRMNPNPLEQILGLSIASIQPVTDDGQVLYYAVTLAPDGFVIVSADDCIEPIIAFGATGSGRFKANSPASDLLRYDMNNRNEWIAIAPPPSSTPNMAQSKWNRLLSFASESGNVFPPPDDYVSQVSDLRVPALLKTEWDQHDVDGEPCYNYYTPNHYPSGCVITAFAQIMRYHEFPKEGIGIFEREIKVDDVPMMVTTRGGDGQGGPYRWEDMVYMPSLGITDVQRQAIGALCFDLGVLLRAKYTEAATRSIPNEMILKIYFGYPNAYYYWGLENLASIVQCNLDAGLPVHMSVRVPTEGHSTVCDGYGYDNGTLYHHVNFGWGGYCLWYNLESADTGPIRDVYNFIYNIFTSGSGEIISGRVTDTAGNPIPDVTILVRKDSQTVQQVHSNRRGIYAAFPLEANQEYSMWAFRDKFPFPPLTFTTGDSSNIMTPPGNVWGANIITVGSTPPIPYDMEVSATSGMTATILLKAADEGHPTPPGNLTYIITSLPEHGTLTEPGFGQIESVPHSLAGYKSALEYQSCPYFAGLEQFQFKANDGGTPPSGGDSSVATIQINVERNLVTLVHIGNSASREDIKPFDTTYRQFRLQTVYLQGDIGRAQPIIGFALNALLSPGCALHNWTIRIKHTTQNKAVFEKDGWTVVYQADEFTPLEGWNWFEFTTPFEYNGIDNLFIDFSFNNPDVAEAGLCESVYTELGRATYGYSDATTGDPLQWPGAQGVHYYNTSILPVLKLTASIQAEPIPGDFQKDCMVNMTDMAVLSNAWDSTVDQPHYNADCDISVPINNQIDINDLRRFADHWLSVYSQ
ncbi:MAG: C10 family peptidase [Sedimentisphaerales bacterium]|nr:C10 family peptidase [Sedimentisphaerales bacterium]